MAQITITVEVDDEDSDPQDSTGLTLPAFDRLFEALTAQGFQDIDVRAGLR